MGCGGQLADTSTMPLQLMETSSGCDACDSELLALSAVGEGQFCGAHMLDSSFSGSSPLEETAAPIILLEEIAGITFSKCNGVGEDTLTFLCP